MIVTSDLSVEQRNTLKGLVDATCPACSTRIRYYNLAESMGYEGAYVWLASVPNVNHNTLELLKGFLDGLGPK